MATESRVFTGRTYRAGGFLLMLGGVIGAIVGLGLLIAGATGGVLGYSALVTGLFGGYLLVFSVIEFAGGVTAYRGHNWYGAMTAGILGMLSLITLPIELIGVILVALGEGTFDHGSSEER